jgi:hypothetical protein
MDSFGRRPRDCARVGCAARPTDTRPPEITHPAAGVSARTVAAPLAAALAVAVSAVTVLALVHTGGGRPHQIAPWPVVPTWVSRQPSDLVGTWVLTDLQGLEGAAHTAPDAVLKFGFSRNGTVSEGCGAARVTVGVGTLEFAQDWVRTVPANCPHLSVSQSRFLFGRVLTNAAGWEIHTDELTVYRGSAAAAFQRVAPALTAAQETLAVRIAKPEARTASAFGTSASNTGSPGHTGWPASLDRVSALVTTGADAMQYGGATGGDTRLVVVIRLVGEFSWATTGPRGGGPTTGNVMTVVADVRTGEIIDTRVVQQNPPHALPDATILYMR